MQRRGMDNSGTARSPNVAEYEGSATDTVRQSNVALWYLGCSTGERSRSISARQ
jgi:hypothetical protein